MGFTVDPVLVHAARSDEPALETLLAAIWPEAYRMAYGILHDRGLAEDAAQEACAAIAASLSTLRTAEAFYTWMYRIIVRQATLAAKRAKRTAAIEITEVIAAPPDQESRLDILDALARLPIAQRIAFVLRSYAGFNSTEIAAATGAPAATVRFRLALARRSLRPALAVLDTPLAPLLEASQHAR